MQAILFYLLLPLLYAISVLPMWLLHRLSTALYLVIYRLIGYRTQVVAKNLRNSFPNYSQQQLDQLQSKFYHYFCDLVLESIINLTISEVELKQRMVFKDTDVFQKYFKNHQSVIVLMGHWGNWELAGSRFALEPLHSMYVVYKPQKNKQVDKLTESMRTRFGNKVVSMKNVWRVMLDTKDELTATTFIADQIPSYRSAYRLQFLEQDTLVFLGAAKIAAKLNYPVIYAGVQRISRGYYEIHLEELEAKPQQTTPEDLTKKFFQRLEVDIRRVPETWLWSHNRWKNKRTRLPEDGK